MTYGVLRYWMDCFEKYVATAVRCESSVMILSVLIMYTSISSVERVRLRILVFHHNRARYISQTVFLKC